MKAVMIGATGLVGSEILQNLLNDERISSVDVFTRRETGVQHAKLREHKIDFESAGWKDEVKGEIAFSALGTTKAAAGSIEAQYKVDFTYQAEFAKACAKNGVQKFVLISAMGAKSTSTVPYSRMRGELENFIQSLSFKNLLILRPGLLTGHREKKRIGEQISEPILRWISTLTRIKALRPVSGKQVADAAVKIIFTQDGYHVVSSAEICLY